MSSRSETWQVTPKQVNLDLDGDTLREECGVFGIYGHPDAAAITALGLHALQHRGQEAAGIVSFNGDVFHSERKLGHVDEATALYFKALAIDPNNVDTHEYLGEGYVASGRIDLAKAELATVQDLCGNTTCEQYEDLSDAIASNPS